MITLPHGKVVYSDLKISAIKMDKFLKTLQDEEFTGYVKIETPELTGIIFYDMGKIIAVTTFPPTNEPLVSVMEISSRSDGTVNVYAFSSETINILASAVNGKEVFSNVPFEIIDIDRLFSRLVREKFAGVLVVTDEEGDVNLSVFFFEGSPFEYIYESIDSTIKGEEAMGKLQELKNSSTAVMRLYEASFEGRPVEKVGEELDPVKGLEQFFNEILPELSKYLGDKRIRMICGELAETYSFLDPFIPAVYFKDNRIVIEDENIPVKNLMDGLKEFLQKAIEQMKEKDRERFVNVVRDALSDKPLLQSFLEIVE